MPNATKLPGNISRRRDGRYGISIWVPTIGGGRHRFQATASTASDAQRILQAQQQNLLHSVSQSKRVWKLRDYLEYWLEEVVRPSTRPNTYLGYLRSVRLYISPTLGGTSLRALSVMDVQRFLNRLQDERSLVVSNKARAVLRAALSRAQREDLIQKNPAALVDQKLAIRKPITPWSVAQAQTFLRAIDGQPLQLAFQLMTIYGLRRGEALGLRWSDIDVATRTIRIEQQLTCIGSVPTVGPLKTESSRRTLPMVETIHTHVLSHAHRYGRLSDDGTLTQDDSLAFLSDEGTTLYPEHVLRTFHRICARAGLPKIRLHDLRHTAATLLKNLGLPTRDIQLVLGHSRVTTTMQLYQHADPEGQRRAMELAERTLLPVTARGAVCQDVCQNERIAAKSDDSDVSVSGAGTGTLTLGLILGKAPEAFFDGLPASVLERVRDVIYAYKLGRSAVKNVCQSISDNSIQDTRPIGPVQSWPRRWNSAAAASPIYPIRTRRLL